MGPIWIRVFNLSFIALFKIEKMGRNMNWVNSWHFMILMMISTYEAIAQQMSILSPINNPLKLEGQSPVHARLNEEGQYRGYFGSISGANQDIDFGTPAANTVGKVHLTIQMNPQITVGSNGNVGIGTQFPDDYEKLTMGSGNIQIANSDKGVILNASDRALISRGWDLFTSGIHQGIGRWGIFMEYNRLAFGIPNTGSRAVEFSAYNEDGTRNPLLTIKNNNKITRPATGNIDLLPIAIGSVGSSGTILGGTGNFNVLKENDGRYSITIMDETHYFYTDYFVQVTISSGANPPYYVSVGEPYEAGNRIVITIFKPDGSITNQDFQFIVHRIY